MPDKAVHPSHCGYCGAILPVSMGRGRVRRYCNATCRSAARRLRSRGATGNAVKKGLTYDRVRSTVAVVSGIAAVIEARDAARTAEQRLGVAVEQARRDGHTWADIGSALGTSRQAAFQRFGRALDPRTGKEMREMVITDAADRAIGVIAALADGRWQAACADFDETIAERLDADGMAAVWAQLAGTAGRYEHLGDAFPRQLGDLTVVDIPMYFEAAEFVGRFAFRADGKIAGVHFLPPTAV